MPGSDNRKINSGITLPDDQAGPKGPRNATRTWTKADDFDELEKQLTAEQVHNLKQPDPVTGVPVLEGNWKGRHAGRAAMPGSPAHKAALQRGDDASAPVKVAKLPEAPDEGDVAEDFQHLTKADLETLCDENDCTPEGKATKADLAAALAAKGVKPPK